LPRQEIARLFERLKAGDFKALSRLITLADDSIEARCEMAPFLYPVSRPAIVIGITGPAGCGKSTLLDRLLSNYRGKVSPLAVLAFDPCSRFSGGALLGDRARMADYSSERDIFIRSLAGRDDCRGIGGVLYHLIQILSAFGFDRVFVETLGAGQADTEAAFACDLVVLVLTPGYGDEIQAMKAGLLEVGDVIAVNKADLGGAEAAAEELFQMLSLGHGALSDRESICVTSATSGAGVVELASAIDRKLKEHQENGLLEQRRRRRYRAHLELVIKQRWLDRLIEPLAKETQLIESNPQSYLQDNPYEVADKVLKRLLDEIAKR
jgi:LAO/AO transport system kinase